MSGKRHEPLTIECTREPAVESTHLVDVAVVDPDGAIVEGWGGVDRVIYPRSAIKSIQVLPLFETGVADKIAVTDAEIAVACSSHNGQPAHVETVRNWLSRCGLSEDDLECGGHLPYHTAAAHACIRAGEKGLPIHNMCSGKHTAFLVTAATLGEATAGYIERDHPVQQRVSAAIAEMTGWDLSRAPWGRDGCSIPTIGMPLHALARGAARIADPLGLSDERRAAILRIRQAIAAEPFMIAGDDRACTAITQSLGDKALVKFGAEGVFFAALPTLGLGMALKVRDGAKRAADVATAAMLDRLGLLGEAERADLARYLETPLKNWRGFEIGVVRARFDG